MRVRREIQAIIMDEKNDRKYVLLVKKLHLKNLSSRWRILKGGVENGETNEHAIKREINEEVGLKNIKILKKIYTYEFDFFGTHHIVSTYLVKGDMKENLKINTREVVGARWIPLDQAVNLLELQEEKNALKQVK